MTKYKIPLFTPYLNHKEKEYVLDCLKTNWISSKGKYIEKFEKKFSNYVNAKYNYSKQWYCCITFGFISFEY